EAQDGGPIAFVRDGDVVTIDADNRSIDVDVSEGEMNRRKADWSAPAYKATRGTLRKYIKCVRPADVGCVTDE
ncbi:MAG: dihydroxy-acid dehydratase, partial [Rhodothermales bacterium]